MLCLPLKLMGQLLWAAINSPLKLNTEAAPTVQEMNNGAGIYRIVNHIAKKCNSKLFPEFGNS